MLAYPQGCNHSIGDKNGNSISKFESSLLSGSSKSDPKPVQWQVVKNIDQPTPVDGLQYGKIAINKDFGAGYKYDIIMEEASGL